METVSGVFPAVETRWTTGQQRFRVYITERRLVAVYLGQRRRSSWVHLGLLGMLIEAWLLKRRQPEREAEMRALDAQPLEVLRTRHAKNFELPVDMIHVAKLEPASRLALRGPAFATLSLTLSATEKPRVLWLETREDLQRCVQALKAPLIGRLELDPKLIAKKMLDAQNG